MSQDRTQWLNANPEWKPYADLILMPPSPEELREEFPECSPGDAKSLCGTRVRGQPYSRATFYTRLRREGTGHRLADTLASQQFPGLETEDTFWSGYRHFSEVYGESYANAVRQELARKGCNLSAGDEYLPEMAQEFGDPNAVISRANGGRARIREFCRERGLACEGAVNCDSRPPDRDPFGDDSKPALAEDLVQDCIETFTKEDPDAAAKMSHGELREAVIDKHGFKL